METCASLDTLLPVDEVNDFVMFEEVEVLEEDYGLLLKKKRGHEILFLIFFYTISAIYPVKI